MSHETIEGERIAFLTANDGVEQVVEDIAEGRHAAQARSA